MLSLDTRSRGWFYLNLICQILLTPPREAIPPLRSGWGKAEGERNGTKVGNKYIHTYINSWALIRKKKLLSQRLNASIADGGSQILDTYRPASLIETLSFWFSVRSCPKEHWEMSEDVLFWLILEHAYVQTEQ